MKNHRGKRRKKAKRTVHKETSTSEAYEIDPLLRAEKVKGMKPDELQFNLVCEDHYSLYERTPVRDETRKEDTSSEPKSENELRKETKRVLKGQRKSALPPLKESTQRRKRLTFEGKIRASKHSTLDTKPEDERDDMTENIVPISSESQMQKTLASLSFVGIYDLDDMSKTKTKKSKKLDGILKSSKQLAEIEMTSEKIAEEVVDESDKRTKSYVIQTLTLEGQSPLSNKTLFQDKFILPGISKQSLSIRSNKIFDDSHITSQRRERQFRESKNRLPSIVQSDNRNPRRGHRGKLRAGDNSIEQVYLDRNIPRLPLIVNGRTTQS